MNNHADEPVRHHGWCAMCRSRCGCVSVVRDGRLVAVEPDPEHPTGAAICAKGRAVPELVYAEDRVLYPMVRTRPKGDPDPGWQRVSWDEALTRVAAELNRLRAQHGSESVAYACTTGSGTSVSDGSMFIDRLMRAFGSPNNVYGTEICNWHKDEAFKYTFGAGVSSPDFERTACIIMWGHNPNVSWLSQGSRTAKARARGARLIVVDPRRVGPAAKADHWLRVRPGTDGALALAMAHVLLESGQFDEAGLRQWSSGPFLIHPDGHALSAADAGIGPQAHRVVVDMRDNSLVAVDPDLPVDAEAARHWLLDTGQNVLVEGANVHCKTGFALYRELCADMPPERAETITGVPSADIRAAAVLLWTSRPVSLYAWTGVGQHTNATQTARAISLLYALLGSFDAPGGNVRFAAPPTKDVSGRDLLTQDLRRKTIGLAKRPLGPPKDGWITSDDFYRAVLEQEPYSLKGLVVFGTNLLVSHVDTARGVDALRKLDFHVHADLFMTPTAQYADVFLPVNTAWERRAMRVGFEMNEVAQSWAQYRHPVIETRGESRSDEWITFALAQKLGLGNHFWDGDADRAYEEILAPMDVSLDELRAAGRGVEVPAETPFHRHIADAGFATSSRRVEVWSEPFASNGQNPLPAYKEPAMSPVTRPDLSEQFPLVLTSAKSHAFCHSQHRNLKSLRRLQREPRLEMHPRAAAERDIAEGDAVVLATPVGEIELRAKLRDDLAVNVVAGQHGWWQGCEALDLPERPAIGPGSANFNAVIGNEDEDPISGSTPHRSYLCEVRKISV